MRRTRIGDEAFLLRLSWETRAPPVFWALGGQAAACFFGIVAKIRPVDTA